MSSHFTSRCVSPVPVLRSRLATLALPGLALGVLSVSAGAQGITNSPGQARTPRLGQTTRFSTDFNPAFGIVVDGFTDFLDDDVEDGFDAQLRIVELNGSAYVDPEAWSWVAITSENAESPEIEEAAVVYTGFEGNTTLRAGRFFVDFGKQMQWHVEDLRTLERPLVLREFLGEELPGTGVQVDHWLPVGETSVLRFSAGAYASLLGEGHHGEEEEEEEAEAESSVPDRRDFDELSFAARATAMSDVGDNAQIQFGLSGRIVPEFAFEFEGAEASGLSNTVYGLDLTYEGTDESGNRSLLLGGEYLVFDGDLSAEVDDSGPSPVLDVVDDTVTGALLYADYSWNMQDSVGLQYSFIEQPEDPDADASELDLYFTRHFTEFRRARLGVTRLDADGGGDEFRVYLQFTAFLGAHAHGVNW